MEYSNDSKYEGQFYVGMKYGNGTMTMKDGGRYQATWFRDSMDGRVIYTNKDGVEEE